MAGYTHGVQFSEDMAEKVLERVVKSQSVRSICAELDLGDRRIIARWRESNPEFDKEYKAAQLEACHELLDETLPIADDQEEDAQSRKVRIWARHELIKRKRPDVFSDKVNIAHSGEIGKREMTDDELDAEITKRLAEVEKDHG